MVKIEKLDNTGRGICYVNNKITFVPNTLPDEEVEVKITKGNSKYQEGVVTKFLKKSNLRLEPICKYYNKCGGCKLLHTNYLYTIDYKKNKVKDILHKYANEDLNIDIIPSPIELNYRNKISLRISNNKVGYYEANTHKLVDIDNCYLAEESINSFIKDIKYLNVKDGEITIRSNYNQELLIIISTKVKPKIDINYLKRHHKIAGIVVNDKKYYNDDFFIEIVNDIIYKVSYNSFFQINRYVSSIIFNNIKESFNKDDIVLDLYSGVGTLGLSIASIVKKVYGIEIVENAVINATNNSKINKLDNTYYMVGDVGSTVNKIKDKISGVIVDPPRAGLDNNTKKYLLDNDIDKIVYVSCNPITLARDIKELKSIYNIKNITCYDMFPYSEHCESITVLERR